MPDVGMSVNGPVRHYRPGSSKKLDTAGWLPTNKGRSGSRMRSTLIWLPSGSGAHLGRSSSKKSD
jgi:hypothetical protein